MIDANEYGLSTPEEIFHYEIFQDNPRLFYKFAGKMLYPSRPHEPSPTHKFLSLLNEKKMLLRVYTQNVDGLEEKAGVPPKKVVYAHGSLHTSKCLKCGAKGDTEIYRQDVLSGNVPYCRRIITQRKRKRKESHDTCQNDSEITISCGGIVKPNITFFGEPLDDRVTRSLEVDREKADAVIVIGTSLSVAPISKIVDFLRPSIPRILINRTIVIPKHTDNKYSSVKDDHVQDDRKEAKDENDDDDDDDDEKEKDFRNGYLFDALLLGFCDDITNSLAKVLWGDCHENHERLSSESHGALSLHQQMDCKLLRDDMTQINDLGMRCLLNHPPERILIFPGTIWKAHEGEDDDDEVECYHEIVNCNECNCIISGMVFKCNDCFDYDLCKTCHSKVKRNRSHHGGKHKFTVEE
jgi:NAD-dependent SIR2 family protein deacetylase